jgi:hypothetical protein
MATAWVVGALNRKGNPLAGASRWQARVEPQKHDYLPDLFIFLAATLIRRRTNYAVSQGRCLVPWILA